MSQARASLRKPRTRELSGHVNFLMMSQAKAYFLRNDVVAQLSQHPHVVSMSQAKRPRHTTLDIRRSLLDTPLCEDAPGTMPPPHHGGHPTPPRELSGHPHFPMMSQAKASFVRSDVVKQLLRHPHFVRMSQARASSLRKPRIRELAGHPNCLKMFQTKASFF